MKHHRTLIVLFLAALAAPALAIRSHYRRLPIASPVPRLAVPPYQSGIASWYGKNFQGKQTSSGKPFNMYGLSAAHRTLPLGSWIRVTNLLNNRSVNLQVDDRGPVPQNRIIDLSYAAARALHFCARGTAPVSIDLLHPAPRRASRLILPQLAIADQWN